GRMAVVLDRADPSSTCPAERSWALPAAAGVAALETTALITALAIRAPRAAPYSIALLATKYPFCLAMLARRHGAYLVIWLWELTPVGAALLNPGPAGWSPPAEVAAAARCL